MIDEIVKNALEKLDNDINNNDVDSITNKAIEEIEKVNPEVSKGKKALASGNNNDGIEIIIQVIIIILAQVITKILLNCQALVKKVKINHH